MSYDRYTKIAQPSNPPATTCEVYYDITLGKLCVVDASGNQVVLGGFGVKDYRVIKVTEITATGTYTPSAGAKALFVECIGGGGGGGGCPSPSTSNASAAAGGGGGAYSAIFLTSILTSYSVTVGVTANGGVGAANGTTGNDTIFGSSVCVAKGGAGGTQGAAGAATAGTVAAVAGGASGSGVGDITADGNGGGPGLRISGTVGVSGFGGAGPLGGSALSLTATGTGTAGGKYGSGGAGALSLNNGGAATGGAGSAGLIRVTEYA